MTYKPPPYIPFEARVAPEVYALCKALHQIEVECERFRCERERHEDDALALLAWLEEYGFVLGKKP
jgi:hypothetical protein